MRAFISSVYLFLYAPIALVVLFSFNAGRNASEFTGFSLAWYGQGARQHVFSFSALQNSLIIAFTSATLAASSAHGGARHGTAWLPPCARSSMLSSPRRSSSQVSSSASRRWSHSSLSSPSSTRRSQPSGRAISRRNWDLGYGSIIAAHRALLDGARHHDREGAHREPRPRHRRGVGRPLCDAAHHFPAGRAAQILPSILAGFLLAFTFSFDDFIIAFFVAGSKTTLPIYVFASIRRGVTPEINAIADPGSWSPRCSSS